MKLCPACCVTKPAGDYYRHPGKRDGLQTLCKLCFRAQQNQRVPKPPKSTDDPATQEHRETVRQIGVHRAMDVFPLRCHYLFGTSTPCLRDKAADSCYCPEHRDSEAAR